MAPSRCTVAVLWVVLALACRHSGDAKAASSAASGSSESQVSHPDVHLKDLPEPARKELAAVFTDEFCYCGCPHTLGGCLRDHKECKHAPRMAVLARELARQGIPSVQIINALGTYYGSFREPRAKVPVDDRMCLGPKDAKVTFAEFSDFECPYCAAARPTLEAFIKKHLDRVRLCFVPYPLQNHPNAVPAAQAALFARDKGKFWPMHDGLFDRQFELGHSTFMELAKKVGVDAAELSLVFSQNRYVDEIAKLKEMGKAAGVDSTPSVFVNGRRLKLDLNGTNLSQTLEDELDWMAHNQAWAD